jgi:hypothetical protein
MTDLKTELYNLCKYNYTDTGYIKYNKIIWDELKHFDDEALQDTIDQLKGLL